MHFQRIRAEKRYGDEMWCESSHLNVSPLGSPEPQPTPMVPLYLAPMAGVTNTVFRQLLKEKGVDVVTTEFVSAEGIFHRNQRTTDFLAFTEAERPVGVQLFGGDPDHLAEAARHVVDWVRPDFIDLNFGCPVNKVVAKNGGSALLRDCPLLERVASAVVRAVAPLPVTAKIRIGWDDQTINAVTTVQILEACGIQRVAIHGRTRSQGYSGAANWEVIAEAAGSTSVPVVGNGDITDGATALARVRSSGVRGLMIGRAAMGNPWVFDEIRAAFDGRTWVAPQAADRWAFIVRHCREESVHRGSERHAMHGMRARLMAYTRGMPGGRDLRVRFQFVESVAEVEDIAAEVLARGG